RVQSSSAQTLGREPGPVHPATPSRSDARCCGRRYILCPRSSSKRRWVNRGSRRGSLLSVSRIAVRTSIHSPSFGAGCTERSFPQTEQHFRFELYARVQRASEALCRFSQLGTLRLAGCESRPGPLGNETSFLLGQRSIKVQHERIGI